MLPDSGHMLAEYIAKAMEGAKFERLENSRYFGTVSEFQGAWAEADSIEKCRRELAEVLEDWILLAIRRNLKLPVFPGITDLNRVGQAEYAETD
jgi:predicted RNase H-like HicB family nuclease